MTTPKIYLETTMFNFLFVPDVPGYIEHKIAVQKVFDMIKAGRFEPFTSIFSTDEIDDTAKQEKRDKLNGVIAEYRVKILDTSPEVKRLAELYIEAGAIPAEYSTDAAHIAITAVNGIDFIASLNFEHIVKQKTIRIVGEINALEGYKSIGIYKPLEVLDL